MQESKLSICCFNTLKNIAVKEEWNKKKKEQHNKIAIKTLQKTAKNKKRATANSDP